jgi:hypothetical protein
VDSYNFPFFIGADRSGQCFDTPHNKVLRTALRTPCRPVSWMLFVYGWAQKDRCSVPLPFYGRWLLYIPPGLTFRTSKSCRQGAFVCFCVVLRAETISYSTN